MPQSEKSGFGGKEIAVVTALAALACITTLVIRIPIPATGGYFNIGDVFVLFGALWLGPVHGMLIGAIGPTIADAIGYPQFILATFVVKGLEGLIAGLVAGRGSNLKRKAVAAYSGAAVMVVGYFIFEAVVYPVIGRSVPFFAVTNASAATLEIFPNVFQGVVGATVAFGLWRAVRREA